MEVKIEDLEVGDEIIIGAGARLKYLKILRTPQIRNQTKSKYPTNTILYKNLKCSMNVEENTVTYLDYTGKQRSYITTTFKCTPENHNKEIYQDLNHKTIWLVKKVSI